MTGKSPRLNLIGMASLVLLAGCAAPKPAPLAMRFVPPASPAAEAPRLPPAPNLYLAGESPSPNIERYRLTSVPTPSDMLAARAEEALQRGRRYYQSGDKENARRQFDRAVDLLFQASEQPSDRAAFERKFDEMIDAISRYDLAGLGPSAAQEVPGFEKSPLEDILEMTFPVDPKLKSKVKEEVAATVSQLPLTVNDSVLGFIQFFSGRGRNTLIAGMKRAGRYRPLIQRILDEEGLPPELIYLAQAESGFHPRAVSRVRATGMWQFMQFRGREYGLTQTPYSDDRLDPERATRAAARHLRDLYHQFGDWYLAIAAYNCGPGNVQKAVERTGYADFWQLRSRRTLPLETTNYVPIILAMTIMQKNAARYDIEDIVPDPPLMYDVVSVASPTHLALIADLTETPVAEIQQLNPALLKSIAPAGYRLRVPHGSANSLLAALDLVPPERRASWRMHRVESGETLADIGRLYKASPNVIAAANHITADDPETGDLLMIPQAAVRPAVLKTPARTPSKSSAKRKPAKSGSNVTGTRTRRVGRT
jgi:membrane-bound lytic murein transglycosylase D